MDVAQASGLLQRVAAVREGASRDELAAAVGHLRLVRSWVEAEEVRLAAQVVAVSSFPEKTLADAGRGSLRDAGAVLARVSMLRLVPSLAAALAAGRITGEHVDALARRWARLEQPVRDRLLAAGIRWAAAAAVRTPERFGAFVAEQVRLVDRRDGEDRLAAQQRQVSLSWRLAGDGMHEWKLLLDPLEALRFERRVAAQVEALFHDTLPEGCPTNPLQRQAYLRAHALLSLLAGAGGKMGRPEIIVVVDTREPEGAESESTDGEGAVGSTAAGPAGSAGPPGAEPRVDWGLPVELPARVLVELFGRAEVHPLVVRNGVVLHAGGQLDLGRSTRLANKAQRRALRGLYATCSIPGCSARFDHCRIHHVHWWRHGGRTDLRNLLPLCSRHHHLVHEGGWKLSLQPDRVLTVHLPDGTIMTTGPPQRSAA